LRAHESGYSTSLPFQLMRIGGCYDAVKEKVVAVKRNKDIDSHKETVRGHGEKGNEGRGPDGRVKA